MRVPRCELERDARIPSRSSLCQPRPGPWFSTGLGPSGGDLSAAALGGRDACGVLARHWFRRDARGVNLNEKFKKCK